MTTTDPKRTVDEFGVLLAPRFVPSLPKRTSGDQGRIHAARVHAAALRERPGKWAAIAEAAKPHQCGNVQSAIRKGAFGPAGHWECSMRKDPERGIYILYVRFIGRGANQ